MLILRTEGDKVRIQKGDDQIVLTFAEVEDAMERLNNLHRKIACEKVQEVRHPGELINPDDFTIMQQVHPQTGEPIGPPIDLRKKD